MSGKVDEWLSDPSRPVSSRSLRERDRVALDQLLLRWIDEHLARRAQHELGERELHFDGALGDNVVANNAVLAKATGSSARGARLAGHLNEDRGKGL